MKKILENDYCDIMYNTITDLIDQCNIDKNKFISELKTISNNSELNDVVESIIYNTINNKLEKMDLYYDDDPRQLYNYDDLFEVRNTLENILKL